MTGIEFSRRLAEKGYSYRESKKIYRDFMATLAEMLADGESLTVSNFGKFEVFDRKYNGGDAPKWVGADLQFGDSYKAVRFVPAPALKVSVVTGVAAEINPWSLGDGPKHKFQKGHVYYGKKNVNGSDE